MLDTNYFTFYQRGPELDRKCEAAACVVRGLKGLQYRVHESDQGNLHPQLSLRLNWFTERKYK